MYFPGPLSWETPGRHVLTKEGNKAKMENRGLKPEIEPRGQDKGLPKMKAS